MNQEKSYNLKSVKDAEKYLFEMENGVISYFKIVKKINKVLYVFFGLSLAVELTSIFFWIVRNSIPFNAVSVTIISFALLLGLFNLVVVILDTLYRDSKIEKTLKDTEHEHKQRQERIEVRAEKEEVEKLGSN